MSTKTEDNCRPVAQVTVLVTKTLFSELYLECEAQSISWTAKGVRKYVKSKDDLVAPVIGWLWGLRLPLHSWAASSDAGVAIRFKGGDAENLAAKAAGWARQHLVLPGKSNVSTEDQITLRIKSAAKVARPTNQQIADFLGACHDTKRDVVNLRAHRMLEKIGKARLVELWGTDEDLYFLALALERLNVFTLSDLSSFGFSRLAGLRSSKRWHSLISSFEHWREELIVNG